MTGMTVARLPVSLHTHKHRLLVCEFLRVLLCVCLYVLCCFCVCVHVLCCLCVCVAEPGDEKEGGSDGRATPGVDQETLVHTSHHTQQNIRCLFFHTVYADKIYCHILAKSHYYHVSSPFNCEPS